MLEREIPKEIRDYKTKYLFKLTLRQNVAFGCMLVINVLLHLYAKAFIYNELVDWLMLVVAVVTGAIALWRPNKQDFEKVAWFALQSELVKPKKRTYQTRNTFSALRESYLKAEVEAENKQLTLDKYQGRRDRVKNTTIVRRLNKQRSTSSKREHVNGAQGEFK